MKLMKMSNFVWWMLAGSIPIALIIMVIAWLIMRKKIQCVKTSFAIAKPEDLTNPALNREDHGLLLWDLREKTKNPLSDLSMEFVINTILRNRYKTFYIEGFEEKYEEKTIISKTSIKKVGDKFDFALISFDKNFIDRVDELLKKMNNNSMIIIVNSPKNKEGKNLLSYLKMTGIRNEFHKVDKGIILIAK